VQIGLMIEGQNGLTWERWRRILQAAEELGFGSVFRSDHFTNPTPPDKSSLELWTSLTYAASHTTRIEFGPLVTPITFRHPAITVKMAAAVDDLSDGRLVLGMGAGWQDREHQVFGVPFPPVQERYTMLRDGLEVVTRLLRNDEPVTYAGQAFSLDEALLLPRPARPGGPPILIGGNGERRTMPLAARYADEWNAVFVGPEQFGVLQQHFDDLLDQRGRPRDAVLRSVMLGTLFTPSERVLHDRLAARDQTLEDIADQGIVAGTSAMWVNQLSAYAEAGADRVMLQWLDLDNTADLETIAQQVLPALAA
ncbi:MAG: TIGR03560 family F420-dependent LLM class oxidoreductase, partial [Chloroflexota bacterium]